MCRVVSRVFLNLNTNLQQARITLARAIYSPAEILLLDDVLAALDVHTSQWVVTKCFKGDLVRGRTIILVVSIYGSMSSTRLTTIVDA